MGKEDEDSPSTPVSSFSSVMRVERTVSTRPYAMQNFRTNVQPRPTTPPIRQVSDSQVTNSRNSKESPTLVRQRSPVLMNLPTSTNVDEESSSTLGNEEGSEESLHPDLHILRGDETLQNSLCQKLNPCD